MMGSTHLDSGSDIEIVSYDRLLDVIEP